MKALILAAGYATRLYPLTRDFPKPLLEVKNKPVIDYIIDKLDKQPQIDEIIVITNDKFSSVFNKWAGHKKGNKKIKVISDATKSLEDRLGSIGDISFAIQEEKINSDLLVAGGDNLFDQPLDGFLNFFKESKAPIVGLYDVKNKVDARNYGVVRVDRNKRIIDFQEKSKHPKSTLAAMCLYLFPKGKLRLVSNYLKEKKGKHDAAGYYIDWLHKQDKVYGYIFGGRWHDIGHHKFYNTARKTFKG